MVKSNFDLVTYRGQWSQVELALDFQLENNQGWRSTLTELNQQWLNQRRFQSVILSPALKKLSGNPENHCFCSEPQLFPDISVKETETLTAQLFSLLSLEKTQSSSRFSRMLDWLTDTMTEVRGRRRYWAGEHHEVHADLPAPAFPADHFHPH